jgi:asparagine synthase (glutamine-hydrolysing)
MCGISGIASKRLDEARLHRTIERMAASLRHRGPDGTDIRCFVPPAISEMVALGHNRLAIIDVSDAGREPMSNEDGTVWLVFNGEIYNFADLRPDLESRGHRFRSRTDAEVILHLYEESGAACVNQLNGIFAFAILDLKRELLFLARDPIGVKPLFYAAPGETFLFGSEIKAILASSMISRAVNWQAASDFFTFLYVPGPDTIFEGVFQVPPAHTLTVRLGDHSISMARYWNVSRLQEVEHSSYQTSKEQLRETLAASVTRQLVSDVPIGVFLSGGIDSTIVAGLAKREKPDVETYTLGFPGRGYEFYNEAEMGRAVSKHLGTRHFELSLESPDLLEIVDLVECSDQPFANPTTYLMHQLSKRAREHITVALCGAGGDELFAGYPRSSAVRLARKLNWAPRPLLRFGGKLLSLLHDSHKSPRLRRARQFLEGLDPDFVAQYANWTYFMDEPAKQRLFSKKRDSFGGSNGWKPSVNILRDTLEQCSLPNADNRILELDLKTFLPDNILEYTDRMSMATALEVRVPLLDAGFVELSLNTPFHYKIRNGRTKAVLVDAFEEFFPPAVRNAPKRGFNAPLGQWISQLFDPYFEASYQESHPLRKKLGDDVGVTWRNGILDFDFMQQLRGEHRKGVRDNSHELFACIIFDTWWRKYIDQTQQLVYW